MSDLKNPPLWCDNPVLACVYDLGSRISDVALRIVAGGNLIPHGLGKITGEHGVVGFSQFISQLGFPFPLFFAWTASLTELVGGIFIMLGLLTRPAAFAAIILMSVILFGVHLGNGFFNQAHGFEYPLMWLIVLIAVFCRGSGPYSLDALLFKKQF